MLAAGGVTRSSLLKAGCALAVPIIPAPAPARRVATMASDKKTVLVPIGTGSEEMEAVIIIDVLRRAGAAVTVASVEPELTVVCESPPSSWSSYYCIWTLPWSPCVTVECF